MLNAPQSSPHATPVPLLNGRLPKTTGGASCIGVGDAMAPRIGVSFCYCLPILFMGNVSLLQGTTTLFRQMYSAFVA